MSSSLCQGFYETFDFCASLFQLLAFAHLPISCERERGGKKTKKRVVLKEKENWADRRKLDYVSRMIIA